jgi:hypothetical protein
MSLINFVLMTIKYKKLSIVEIFYCHIYSLLYYKERIENICKI